MSIGGIFLLIAAILFLLLALGATIIPGQLPIGLFCLSLGLLIGGRSISTG